MIDVSECARITHWEFNQAMLLPNLFIPGAAKSGTSSLHDYVQQHPDIFMSAAKEPHFFSNAAHFQKEHGEKLATYAKLFEGSEGYRFRGESSTGYMVFPHVIQRIKAMIPDPKFIFILRNPIDRAYSHYWWLRGRGFETRTFREAMLADMNETPDPENSVKGFGAYRYYYAFGQYGSYLRAFIDEFGYDSIAVITTEDLKADAVATLNVCYKFLGVSEISDVTVRKSNETVVYRNPRVYGTINSLGSKTGASRFLRRKLPTVFRGAVASRQLLSSGVAKLLRPQTSYPPISQKDRDWLQEMYADEVSTLRELTGLRFEKWLSDFPTS